MSTPPRLHTALRAHAHGLHPLEAATELLISHGSFLSRSDFRDRFVHHSTSITDDTTTLANIDWPAAVTALDTAHLPCSTSQQQILRIAASLAHGIPVDLHDTLTGLDQHNIQLVITAVLHASGQQRPAKLHDHL